MAIKHTEPHYFNPFIKNLWVRNPQNLFTMVAIYIWLSHFLYFVQKLFFPTNQHGQRRAERVFVRGLMNKFIIYLMKSLFICFYLYFYQLFSFLFASEMHFVIPGKAWAICCRGHLGLPTNQLVIYMILENQWDHCKIYLRWDLTVAI